MNVSNRLLLALAGLSLLTAGIHGAVVGDHLREFPLFGIFFAVAAICEVAWAITVSLRPTPALLGLGAVCDLALVFTWVLSRTIGLPFGPHPGMAEAVGGLDVLCTTAEVALVAMCVRVAPTASQSRTPFYGTHR